MGNRNWKNYNFLCLENLIASNWNYSIGMRSTHHCTTRNNNYSIRNRTISSNSIKNNLFEFGSRLFKNFNSQFCYSLFLHPRLDSTHATHTIPKSMGRVWIGGFAFLGVQVRDVGRGVKVHAKFSQGFIKPSRSRDKPIKQHDSAKAGATWAVSYRSCQRSPAAPVFCNLSSPFLIIFYFIFLFSIAYL